MNTAQHVMDTLALEPGRTAIMEASGKRVNRGQLRHKILRRASCLLKAGLTPGDRVVVQAAPGIDLATSAIAVMVAGGVLVLAETSMSPVIYRERMAKANVAWFVVSRKLHWVHCTPGLGTLLRKRGIPLPPPVSAILATRLVTPLPDEDSAEPLDSAIERDGSAEAGIAFTGGTTQDPKGVRSSQDSLQAYLSSINTLMGSLAIECFIADTPQQILYGLYLGIAVWIPSGRGDKRAKRIYQCLVDGQADMFFGPPSTWSRILDLAQRDDLAAPRRLRLVMLGGAPVSNQILKRLEDWLPDTTKILVLYGLTEVGPVCSCDAATRRQWRGQGSLVGSALPKIQISIAHPDAAGVGELVVRGPSVFSGYLGCESSHGILNTGDLARLVEFDGDMQLVLMGRTKDMIIRRGVNIYPASVEPILLDICDKTGTPLLKDCALVGVWDPNIEDEKVVLFYSPATATPVDKARLRERIRNLVSSELEPDELIEIESIPAVGRQKKPDKRALRQLAEKTLELPSGRASIRPLEQSEHWESSK
jgi:acyl-CoA synthetase (AMP-forming)/AMP-acid ligase II